MWLLWLSDRFDNSLGPLACKISGDVQLMMRLMMDERVNEQWTRAWAMNTYKRTQKVQHRLIRWTFYVSVINTTEQEHL